jgi:methylmalonyl-CoA mutase cobalamin-binding subunit
MAKQQVNISISREHRKQFPQVVSALKKAGVEVDQQLKTIGVVSGTVNDENLADLQNIEGVANVEQARSFQIAPPESDVQ